MSLLFAVLALAAGQDPEVNCDKPITQYDMNQCSGREYVAADRAMNAQWRKTLADMKVLDAGTDGTRIVGDTRPGYAAALLTAQRAWIAYRDAHCMSAGFQARGGSMEPMLVSGCMARLTEQRAKQLAQLAETN